MFFYQSEEYNDKQYFSNALFKDFFIVDKTKIIPGPCISDICGTIDMAICLHCKTWVSHVVQWIKRTTNSWPSQGVKNSVIKHGVLCVPIGNKGSPTENIEWRISFSVGEKLLINTFSYTHITVLCSHKNHVERCNIYLCRM